MSAARLVRVGQRLLARLERALDEVFDHLLELGARDAQVHVLGTGRVGREERQVDRGLELRLDSSILAFSAASLRRCMTILSLRDVDALVLLELGDQVVDDAVVDVVATEVRVAVGADDLHDVVADLEDRDVERAAAEVVDRDDLVVLLVEAVRERRRGRLVDDALDVEARDAAGVLGGLALRVVEVRGDGDDRLGDRLAEVVLGGLLELAQHVRARPRAGVTVLAAHLDGHVAVVARDDLVRHALGLFDRTRRSGGP